MGKESVKLKTVSLLWCDSLRGRGGGRQGAEKGRLKGNRRRALLYVRAPNKGGDKKKK